MSKADILARFASDLSDPGAEKSGEYLEMHVMQHARQAATTDREGLIEALREWIHLRREPETMLAVTAVQELCLVELADDLRQLRDEIEASTVFKPHYRAPVDEALSVLGG